MKTCHHVTTALHKLHSMPSPLIFTPSYPFKLSNILIWYTKPIIINQIRIGHMNQLIYPLYEQQLTAPDTLKVVETWFNNEILTKMLYNTRAYSLEFMMADREHPITIEYEGDFDIIGLYGAEMR
jgi:hypothetical protein